MLDDGIALGKFAEGVEPYAPYKYWISETEKEYGIVTLTELRLAGFISSEMQNAAYAKFEVIKKEAVSLPDEVIDLVVCNNPKCITRNEPMKSRFDVIDKENVTLKCRYCEHEVSGESIVLK